MRPQALGKAALVEAVGLLVASLCHRSAWGKHAKPLFSLLALHSLAA
jgi:hypothetical protein